jgi:phosphonate transport system substrate-binding protein
VTWADGLGNWEDGFNSGALRKATDAGLVDMTQIREIWRSKLIPEGPIVLRKSLPESVKLKVTGWWPACSPWIPNALTGSWPVKSKPSPHHHSDYLSIIEARKLKSKRTKFLNHNGRPSRAALAVFKGLPA